MERHRLMNSRYHLSTNDERWGNVFVFRKISTTPHIRIHGRLIIFCQTDNLALDILARDLRTFVLFDFGPLNCLIGEEDRADWTVFIEIALIAQVHFSDS